MATNNNSSSNPRAENMGDVLDVLASGIAKAVQVPGVAGGGGR